MLKTSLFLNLNSLSLPIPFFRASTATGTSKRVVGIDSINNTFNLMHQHMMFSRRFSSSSTPDSNDENNLIDHKDPIISHDVIYFFAQFIGMGIGIYIGRNISKYFFDPTRY
jgi:hypothetical protein